MSEILLTSKASVVAESLAERMGGVQGRRLLFIRTAAEAYGQSDWPWLLEDRDALSGVGFDVTDYTLSAKSPRDVHSALDQVDAVFVSGGNTFYLIQEAQQSGFDEVIRRRVNSTESDNVVYIGASAGSVAAGPDITLVRHFDDPLLAPQIVRYEGFRLVPFIVIPHFSRFAPSEEYRDVWNEAVRGDYMFALLEDAAYMHTLDGETTYINIANHRRSHLWEFSRSWMTSNVA